MAPVWLITGPQRQIAQRARGFMLSLLLSCLACTDSGISPGSMHGVEVTPASARPEFHLTATDGRSYDFARETHGRVTLLLFGYTHCPDVCPVHLSNIEAALGRLSAGERAAVRVVFVTTDPARDSLTQLRAWLDNFDRGFVGLRGSVDEVNAVERSLNLPASVRQSRDSTYDVGHSAVVLVFTADDSLRMMYPFGLRQQEWAADLPRLLAVRPRAR